MSGTNEVEVLDSIRIKRIEKKIDRLEKRTEQIFTMIELYYRTEEEKENKHLIGSYDRTIKFLEGKIKELEREDCPPIREQLSRLTSDQIVHGELIKGLTNKIVELEEKNSSLVEMIARRSGRITKLEKVMATVERALVDMGSHLNVGYQCEYLNMP